MITKFRMTSLLISPGFKRVEGQQSPDNGKAFLGSFTVDKRSFGTDQSNYNSDMTIGSNASWSGGGTVTIYRGDGSTAKIPFELTVKGTATPSVTPESVQVNWIRPSK